MVFIFYDLNFNELFKADDLFNDKCYNYSIGALEYEFETAQKGQLGSFRTTAPTIGGTVISFNFLDVFNVDDYNRRVALCNQAAYVYCELDDVYNGYQRVQFNSVETNTVLRSKEADSRLLKTLYDSVTWSFTLLDRIFTQLVKDAAIVVEHLPIAERVTRNFTNPCLMASPFLVKVIPSDNLESMSIRLSGTEYVLDFTYPNFYNLFSELVIDTRGQGYENGSDNGYWFYAINRTGQEINLVSYLTANSTPFDIPPLKTHGVTIDPRGGNAIIESFIFFNRWFLNG